MVKLRECIVCLYALIAACLGAELNFTSEDDVYKMFAVTFMNFQFELKTKDNVTIVLASSESISSSLSVPIVLSTKDSIKITGTSTTEYLITNLLSGDEYRKFRVFWIPDRFIVMERYSGDKWSQLFTFSDYPPGLIFTHIGFKAPSASNAQWLIDTTVSETNGFSLAIAAPISGSIRFEVQSETEVIIDLFGSAKSYGPNFQVVIGSNDNKKCSMVYSPGAGAKKIREYAETAKILNGDKFIVFWLKWTPTLTRTLTLGTNDSNILIAMTLPDSEFVSVKSLEFGTDDGDAEWEIIPDKSLDQVQASITNDQCDLKFRDILKSVDSIKKVQESNTCPKLESKPLTVDDKINVIQVNKFLQGMLQISSETIKPAGPTKSGEIPVVNATTPSVAKTTKSIKRHSTKKGEDDEEEED